MGVAYVNKGCHMKILCTFITLLGISMLSHGAATNDFEKSVEEKFAEAKLSIAFDRPGALDELLMLSVHDHEEAFKDLLEYALRKKNTYSSGYVEQLTQMLKNSPVRPRVGSFRRSESLSLLDVAIMCGNVDGVKKILELGADLSVSRLVTSADRRTLSIPEAVDILIKKKRNNSDNYGGQKIQASLEDLQAIKKVIDEYTQQKQSKLKKIKGFFSK